jgi:hypothetical protein
MIKPTKLFKSLLVFTVLCGCGSLYAQVTVDPDDTLVLALQDLQSLEVEFSNTDPRLAEPLFQLAREFRDSGRYADAHAALDRGQQIVRMSEGLYTQAQIPYIQEKIDNYADWQQWTDARTLQDHLLWLHRTKTRYITGDLIADFLELSRLHLRGISEDSPEFQAFHFRRASASNWLALAAGERLWGSLDTSLVPILYELVKQQHLQAEAIAMGGRASYELRQIIPGSDFVRDRAVMRAMFYQTGRRLLGQIRDIYAEATPVNLEGVAMANLYLADWEVVFDNSQRALRYYEVAYRNLALADVDAAQLDRFFAAPSLLPEKAFFASLQEAEQARAPEAGWNLSQLDNLQASLYFAEWSPTFPYVRAPYQQQGNQLDSNFALFSFNLSGVTEMSRWLNRDNVQSFGELLNVTLLKPEVPSSSDMEAEFRRRLERLHFRPRLENGRPIETEATLLYLPALTLN